MKNQYFGDVHDYRKYGLLRLLVSTGLSLGVGWMLTADDDGPDGQMKSYLSEPEKWRNHDPLLYEFLKGCQSGDMADGVALIEQSGLLGDAHFFSEIVPDEGDQRRVWAANLIAKMEGRDVVFLDADNGMMIASKRVGQKNSSKFTDWAEVEALWKQGSSVLIYQHYPHENRDSFRQRLAQRLREATGADETLLFSTSHVLFTLLIQDRHSAAIHDALNSSLSDWEGQITLIREGSKRPTELIAQRIILICEANNTWYDQCRETWIEADEILGPNVDWIEDMLATDDEHIEVKEALKAGSVSDALAITARHFEWQQEEEDSDNNETAELTPSLAQALASDELTAELAALIINADPEDVAEALTDRLTFLAQNNDTWRENLRITAEEEEPEVDWIVESLNIATEAAPVRNALISRAAIMCAVEWAADSLGMI